MRIIRAAHCRRMPWKNGGGETAEIATFPEGAGLENFVWRLSAARVVRDGPFSMFPGIDRTLAVLSGGGMELRVGTETTRQEAGGPPLRFAGDQPTEAHLLGGPIEDLNIMTRRFSARHHMRLISVRGAATVAVHGATVLLFCAEGRIDMGGEVLDARDTLVLTRAEATMEIAGQGELYVITIDPASNVNSSDEAM